MRWRSTHIGAVTSIKQRAMIGTLKLAARLGDNGAALLLLLLLLLVVLVFADTDAAARAVDACV
eukprot:8502-Heterococcus_DN1.PRE.2